MIGRAVALLGRGTLLGNVVLDVLGESGDEFGCHSVFYAESFRYCSRIISLNKNKNKNKNIQEKEWRGLR